MRLVRDLMTREPATLRPSDTVERAQREMQLGNIRHLPVLGRDHRLVGILSDRDLLQHPTAGAHVRDLMQGEVLSVAADTELTEAAYMLLSRRIGSLPVCDGDGQLLGILTETDFVRLAYRLLGGTDLEDRAREERESERI